MKFVEQFRQFQKRVCVGLAHLAKPTLLEVIGKMTRPLNTEVSPLAAVTLHYDPGVVVYNLRVVNGNNNKTVAASISYDRNSGTLTAVVSEAGA